MRLLLFCVDDDHICQTHKLSYMYWPDSNCNADFIHKQNLRWMLHTERGKIHEKMPLFLLKSVESVLWYSFNCNYCAKRICDNAFVVFLCWKDINCWRNFNDLASKLKYLEPPKRGHPPCDCNKTDLYPMIWRKIRFLITKTIGVTSINFRSSFVSLLLKQIFNYNQSAGTKGERGFPGIPGIPGRVELKEMPAIPGPPGSRGLTGDRGLRGPKGESGKNGGKGEWQTDGLTHWPMGNIAVISKV